MQLICKWLSLHPATPPPTIAEVLTKFLSSLIKNNCCIFSSFVFCIIMTGQKNRALQVPPVVPYKALDKFPTALFGTMGGTCSAQFSRPVMIMF